LVETPKVDTQLKEYVESHVPTINETPSTALGGDITAPEETVEGTSIDQWNKMIEEAEKAVSEEKKEIDRVQLEPDLPIDSKKKTYMTKDSQGLIQLKEKK
jgi:hypothetical protein